MECVSNGSLHHSPVRVRSGLTGASFTQCGVNQCFAVVCIQSHMTLWVCVCEKERDRDSLTAHLSLHFGSFAMLHMYNTGGRLCGMLSSRF